MAHRLPEPPPGLEAKVNQILADVVTALSTIQPTYKDELVSDKPRGRYWQGILTHPTLPADGGKTAPNKALKPTDQAESWTDMGITLPATMECAVAVDVYDGPQGQGYVVRGQLEVASQEWARTVNVGPETWREQDWALRVPFKTH